MSLPYEINEAVIQCFGCCFHYKGSMEAFLRSAGVPPDLARRHRGEYKFVWARRTLDDLDAAKDGDAIQRRLLTELCRLRKIPDPAVQDLDRAQAALRKMKELAVEHDLLAKTKKCDEQEVTRRAKEQAQLLTERRTKLEALRTKFGVAVSQTNRQEAGYSLEAILGELFSIFEIEYRKPYRTSTEQLDGHIAFEGFDYITEARWRKDRPGVQEIGGFKAKIETKLESTRGLFIAIQGIRNEVVQDFQGRGSKIIFWDGPDLVEVLEGRVDLRDALRFKIKKAAQEGQTFVALQEM